METVYNSKNTLTIGAVSFTEVSAPTIVGSTALYGVLAGSNTVSASTVSATTLIGAGSGITSLDMGNAGSGTLAVARGGTGVASSTGTGSVVLSASPTLTGTVTAATVSATTLTGAGSGITSLDMGNAGSGTLAVARGGTGVTSSTGTGSVVLSANPTLTGTVTAGTFSGSAASLTSFPTLNQNTTGTATYANNLYGNNDALIYTGGTQTSKFVYNANAGTNGSLVLGPNGTPITAGYRGVYIDDGGYTGTAISFQRLGLEKAAMFYTFSTNRIQVFTASSGTGVYLNASATSWTAVSDSRLKNIIEPISNAVAKVDTITPVIYSLKSDLTNKRRAGLIAQEILEILPEAVDIATDEDQTLSLSYTELVPLALAAIKELSAENTALKAQMVAMDARLAALEAK